MKKSKNILLNILIAVLSIPPIVAFLLGITIPTIVMSYNQDFIAIIRESISSLQGNQAMAADIKVLEFLILINENIHIVMITGGVLATLPILLLLYKSKRRRSNED